MVALILLYLLGNIVSIIGFYCEYSVFLNVKEVFIGNMVTGILSLPKSFGDLLCITNRHELTGLFLLAVLFWPVIGFLLKKILVQKSIVSFLIISIIFLLSSWNWLVVTMGLSGI
jgi:hypothetical protein